ncbi:MAG: hypothetical protein GTO45_27590 [Candidatus Aminicenantes bacterium]|nr:hypothetical protein [Candidatus Aminicenantes bacterium]NIM82559.1 hypothetical protein [Candidatus Aminicenantes bacterium]NIN21919.1 hypothetical protein [Candidatus Aminicenantes bacterium]NIN45697.1 hypothetical protein [Candidatus Aminicenantes bacterium]NIN88532.1 hypothetical protein [Candidatus Aminicenantes bacterium]
MNKQMKGVCFIIGILFLSINVVQAVERRQLPEEKVIIPDLTSEAIKIDGKLNENIWTSVPISEEFKTFYPVYGKPLGKETKVWMAYDNKNLYFAFKCYDEPGKVKTSICQRDKMINDDMVIVLLDTMGNKQSCYEFYVNPSGIQGDSLNSAVTGTNLAPDFVWESSAKLTEDGYQVEIGIPLDTIRFKGGKEVKMGVLFVRKILHLGAAGTWPEVEPGQTEFNFMKTVIYNDLKPHLALEVLPNFTYNRDTERKNADEWGESDTATNIGIGFKYGIATSITTEATINPDFSQVESDAFQMEVNQRYPLFYIEKRPFFMEGMDTFDFSIVSRIMDLVSYGLIYQGMMISAVHTRRIVDPTWAAKLSGTAGRIGFAVLAANDKAPGRPWENGINPNEGKEAFWGIARARYSLGSDNLLGVLYSGRHFAGGQNNAVGLDFQYRFFKNARFTGSYLYSRTQEETNAPLKTGGAFNAMFKYRVPNFTVMAAYERYDKNFIMDSAFQQRTDISRGVFYIGPSLYLKNKEDSWLRMIHPYFQYSKLHDMGTGLDDSYWALGLEFYLARMGILKIKYQNGKEAWQGQLFDQYFLEYFGRLQIFQWLYLEAIYRHGDQIYYDPEEPFLGTGDQLRFFSILQPGLNLYIELEFLHNALRRKADKQKVYTVDIYNLLAIYQFNRYFFIRGAVRYDSFQKKLLTDLLASFTLIPGTVLHLGYGSLYESREWQNNQWIPGQGDLINVRNGLFFKISYLWQIK